MLDSIQYICENPPSDAEKVVACPHEEDPRHLSLSALQVSNRLSTYHFNLIS
jgi:hypothetical protein